MATATGLTPAQLAPLLEAVEPAARLIPDHLLRRVIRYVYLDGGHPLHVPHTLCCWVSRDALLAAVEGHDFGQPLPDIVLLLPESLVNTPGGTPELLRAAWRALLHARVDQSVDRLALTPADVRRRGIRLGWTAFQEARAVLAGEHLLWPPCDDRTVWREFVATFLELHSFAPEQLPAWFPGLHDPEAVLDLVTKDLPTKELLAATRPEGAALPEPTTEGAEELLGLSGPCDALAAPETAIDRPGRVRCLTERAERAAAIGNDVRAVISRQQALDLGADRADEIRTTLHADLDRLVRRLQAALHLDENRAAEWRQALPALLVPAARGHWSVGARVLYDLQKICVDSEREVYAADLVEWIVSGFSRPIKRRLTAPRPVHVLRHLNTAYNRLARVPLERDARIELAALLKLEAHHAEERLRDELRPILHRVLDQVGLVPANRVEQVGRDKLVEELLDKLGQRGFLVMSDVRDAVARNQPRLHDLAGPKTFFTGDELIRANRLLARELDGVYHRGEIYFRWLQRLGSLAFGTPWGRWLMLFVILPFGGALMTLKSCEFVIDEAVKLSSHVIRPALPEPAPGQPAPARVNTPVLPDPFPDDWDDPDEPPAAVPPATPAAPAVQMPPGHHTHVPLVSVPAVVGLGLVLLAIIHVPVVRSRVLLFLRALGRGLAFVLLRLPLLVLSSPAVRWLLDNVVVRVFQRYLLAPILFTLPLVLVERRWFRDPYSWRIAVVLTFLILIAVCNVRPIRERLARLGEELMRTWKLAATELLKAVGLAILEAFAWLVEQVERAIYAGDEWLRFRQGESRFTFVAKLVLGLVWFVITYVVRFMVVLLIEPQINPLKHFPVVTVGHKLLIPFIYYNPLYNTPSQAGQVLLNWFNLSVNKANAIAFAIGQCIPGVFGFLAWELLTNWRLYRANLPRDVRPAVIGSHGEKMAGLLRPGFHSGTVSKLFRHLRHANRRSVRRYHLKLEHIEEAVHHFLDRDFLAFLRDSRRWGGLEIQIAGVELAVNRIAVELAAPTTGYPPLELAFEEHAGRLLARIDHAGWMGILAPEQRQALADALAGLYQRAGVDLVQELLTARFGPDSFVCNGDDDRLTICRPDGETTEVDLSPESQAGRSLLLSERPIPWERWVMVWEDDRAGKSHAGELVPGFALLPVTSPPSARS